MCGSVAVIRALVLAVSLIAFAPGAADAQTPAGGGSGGQNTGIAGWGAAGMANAAVLTTPMPIYLYLYPPVLAYPQ
jgi:hypothetical protein